MPVPAAKFHMNCKNKIFLCSLTKIFMCNKNIYVQQKYFCALVLWSIFKKYHCVNYQMSNIRYATDEKSNLYVDKIGYKLMQYG